MNNKKGEVWADRRLRFQAPAEETAYLRRGAVARLSSAGNHAREDRGHANHLVHLGGLGGGGTTPRKQDALVVSALRGGRAYQLTCTGTEATEENRVHVQLYFFQCNRFSVEYGTVH